MAISLCAALAACQQAQDSASNVYGTAGGETGKTYDKIGEMIGLKQPPPPKPHPAQTRYCYKTYSDVICYSSPLPGEEYRLVGFQQSNGKTGYVIDDLDQNSMEVGANAVKPSLQPLKSMNVGPPPAVKGMDKPLVVQSQLKEVIFDPTELEPKELVPEKQQ